MLVLASATVAACGSSENKKRLPRDTAGGAGGEGGVASGTGGERTPSDAGAGGDGNTTPLGGAAGATGNQPTGGSADAGAGGDGTVKPFHGLYVAPTGKDTGDGTTGAPFATLTKAAASAQPGDTIVFLAGAYPQLAGATIPDGVDVMAETAGSATLQGQANTTLFTLAGSTRLEGLKFQTFGTVVKFADAATASGTLTIVDSTFTQCQSTCLELSGTTQTVIEVGDAFVLANGGANFALMTQEANLNLVGGVMQGFTGNVFNLTDDATAALKNTEISGSNTTGQAFLLDKKASASLNNVSIATGGTALITLKGQSNLSINASNLLTTATTPYHCVRSDMDGAGSIDISDSKLHDCGNGFTGSIPGNLTLTRVEVYQMTNSGIDMGWGFLGAGGVIRITDSKFHDCAPALRVGSGSNFNDIKLRGTSFQSTKAGWDTVYLDSSGASTIDLGTLAEPGGNTFLNSNANQTALRNGGTGLYVSAVGNTWIPGVQNADNDGLYAAPQGAGSKLEAAGVGTGRNYVVPYNGSKILLAQNP